VSSHDESYLNKRKYNADAISDKIAPAILQDSVNNGNTNFEETSDSMVKKVKANFSTEINDHANLFEYNSKTITDGNKFSKENSERSMNKYTEGQTNGI